MKKYLSKIKMNKIPDEVPHRSLKESWKSSIGEETVWDSEWTGETAIISDEGRNHSRSILAAFLLVYHLSWVSNRWSIFHLLWQEWDQRWVILSRIEAVESSIDGETIWEFIWIINPVLGRRCRCTTRVCRSSIDECTVCDDDSIDTCDRRIDVDVTSDVCGGVLSCYEDESLVWYQSSQCLNWFGYFLLRRWLLLIQYQLECCWCWEYFQLCLRSSSIH